MKMKLFDWLHNKILQGGIEPLKDFTIGNPCICLSANSMVDDDLCVTPSFGSRYECKASKQQTPESENSYSHFGVDNVQDTSAGTDFFHGFLTIGTLGSEPLVSEPATPTFAVAFENMAEGEAEEVTEDDLKLINYELGKFLEAETKEEWSDESSGRNSQVSTITLTGKQIEGAEDGETGRSLICPLQGYLFGSSIELAETKVEVKREKTSLADLFHRTKTTNGSDKEKIENTEVQAKDTKKSARHSMRNMLKRLLQTSSKSSTVNEKADSSPTKKKINKVLRIFHRKIYPVGSPVGKEFLMFEGDKLNNTFCGASHEVGDLNPDRLKRRVPHGSLLKVGMQACSDPGMPKYGAKNCSSWGITEHWIKTDADFLVLEL